MHFLYIEQGGKWLNKITIYKLIYFYFFKLNEYFDEKSNKVYFVWKDDIGLSVNILREKVEIHAWNIAVLSLIKRTFLLCVKHLCVSLSQ